MVLFIIIFVEIRRRETDEKISCFRNYFFFGISACNRVHAHESVYTSPGIEWNN